MGHWQRITKMSKDPTRGPKRSLCQSKTLTLQMQCMSRTTLFQKKDNLFQTITNLNRIPLICWLKSLVLQITCWYKESRERNGASSTTKISVTSRKRPTKAWWKSSLKHAGLHLMNPWRTLRDPLLNEHWCSRLQHHHSKPHKLIVHWKANTEHNSEVWLSLLVCIEH